MIAGTESSNEVPKIPEPDPEHQKAVAQSPLGRVLGFARSFGLRIAAFLSIAILAGSDGRPCH